MERLLKENPASKPNNSSGQGQKGSPIQATAKINLADYIQLQTSGIHGNPVLISKFEIPGANNMNYEQAHKFVLSNGLYMPTPQIFMNYFCNVLEAFDQRENKSGARILDGNGQPVIGKELEDIYKHLTKDCIAAYKGGKEGVWTWLNARFIRGSGFNGLDLETITGMDSNGNLQPTSTPLLTCHNQNAYVNLQFNNQGLATTPSGDRDYKLGKNINFWTPVKDCVVRFNADFYGADLSCNGYPASANASLGLFACAEGAVQKFNLLQ